MGVLTDKRIVLGVTGGIAAYKAAELVRRLREQGAEVRVVMTRAAGDFVGPLTFQALSGHPVHDRLFGPGDRIRHGPYRAGALVRHVAGGAGQCRFSRPPGAWIR